MRLVSVDKTECPGRDHVSRVTGRIEMGSGMTLDVWFEVPADLQGELSESANPWLVCMLPYALETGEDIAADLPADAELLDNLRCLQAAWRAWYPSLRPVRINVPVLRKMEAKAVAGQTAAFFSGGVDSWFTVLRHAPDVEPGAIGHVGDLINVQGFDIPLDKVEEFDAMNRALSDGARGIGRNLIVIRTNLRRPGSLWHRGWGWLTNGAGLAAAVLVLEKRYSKALIGSSHSYDHLFPWGSHPMTDPLLSTSSLRIVHDGAAFDRVEKTALIARHEVALANLHVCWRRGAASNCGRCPKCVRTMATLSMLGATAHRSAFPVEFEPRLLRRLYIPDANEEGFIREVHRWAAQCGQTDIESAALHALRRSRRIRRLVDSVNRLGSVPGLWRLRARLVRLLVNDGTDG